MAIDGFEWALHPYKFFRLQWEGWGQFSGTGKIRAVHVSPESLVHTAEEIAKQHSGILPCAHKLVKLGHARVANAIKRHPDLFAHILKDKKRMTADEWVSVAESLAYENGGILPCCAWRINNGYSALDRVIWQYPVKFSHIKQETKKGKSPCEWVPIAEELANASGGVLPCYQWLHKNGYDGLAIAKRKAPRLFDHIHQEIKKGKHIEEWVSIAESIAEAHKGLIPNNKWLCHNGHKGLVHAMRRTPDRFMHLRQLLLNSKGKIVGVRINGQIQKLEPASTKTQVA